jgi:hypothetical protein
MKLKRLLCIGLLALLIVFPLVTSLAIAVFAVDNSEYLRVDLQYLAAHIESFCGIRVRTTGTVHFLCSIYMFEDFWLSRVIPVVIRFANLPMPFENSRIEIFGVIEYCKLEGGFFYLNADYWTYATETLPEFQSPVIMTLIVIATVTSLIFYKRKYFP